MKPTRHAHTKGLQVAVSAMLLVLAGYVVRAAALDDYDARLARVITLVESFQNTSEHRQRGQGAGSLDVDFIRQQLPPNETVTFHGEKTTVDNSWLENELAEFERSTKASEHTAAMERITERLKAIREHVQRLMAASLVSRDTDAEKGRLAEILRRPEYTHVAPGGNVPEQLLERLLRWLVKLFPRMKPIQPGSSGWIANVAQVLVFAICIGAIGLLIWKFGPRLVSGRRKKKKKREARIVLGERLEPDQTAADLLAQADGLAREGNLRAAIRKAYIALLCELGDQKIIRLAQHKTNRDYLNAVRDKGSLYPSMRQLTNSFELHWYGFVTAGEAEWAEFRNGYQKIVRSDGS